MNLTKPLFALTNDGPVLIVNGYNISWNQSINQSITKLLEWPK